LANSHITQKPPVSYYWPGRDKERGLDNDNEITLAEGLALLAIGVIVIIIVCLAVAMVRG
jgi:hypothetical protein